MEERLTSRFRWGLCVDVQPPDLETRIAILQLKAERETIAVPSDVVEFVASKFDQSVRELEGALVRVVAWSRAHRAADRHRRSPSGRCRTCIPQTEHEIPPPLILEETAPLLLALHRRPGVEEPVEAAHAGAPHRDVPAARVHGLSLVKIGELFGGRDHTTVLHGIKKVEGEMRARDTHVPAGPGPHPHHPRPRAGGRMSLWKTRGPAVGCGAPSLAPAAECRNVLPSPSTCRRRPLRCGERLPCQPFHSAYYYRLVREPKSNRGWPR